ncbi:hypothetical protein BYT27DRAFT_7226148 [Phlegmacium glaucopus]|nr:hypothetical protein BYT27DRAFT_7226148 [Phlegmacium glaucopus]
MKEEIFKDLIRTTQAEAADWEEAIFHQSLQQHISCQNLTSCHTNATSSLPSTSHITPTVPSTEPQPKALLEILRRATVIFPGNLSACELFTTENDEAIQDKMKEFQIKNPELYLVGGGLRNKALKELWAKADKDLWQSKIDAFARDIDANREEFPLLMLRALQNLCSREHLGSTLMSFTWAFHDVQTDRIKCGQIFTGYDTYKEELVTPDRAQPCDHNAQMEAWLNHADAILSCKPCSVVYQIPLNEDGIPILPQTDTSKATAAQLAQLFDEYLLLLWKFSWGTDKNSSTIPWAEVVEHPHDYFDTSLYKLPCVLNVPDKLKSNPVHIFALYDFFVLASTSLPFKFHSKQEIMKRTSSTIGDELDNSSLSTLSATTTVQTPHPVQSSILYSSSDKSPSEFETPQYNTQPANLSASSASPNTSTANSSSIKANSRPDTAAFPGINAISANPLGITKVSGILKNTKAVEETQPTNSTNVVNPTNVVDPTHIEPCPSTRKSGQARKQADREVVTLSESFSEPAKKRKRLQDRWFYELVVNPASQPFEHSLDC